MPKRLRRDWLANQFEANDLMRLITLGHNGGRVLARQLARKALEKKTGYQLDSINKSNALRKFSKRRECKSVSKAAAKCH